MATRAPASGTRLHVALPRAVPEVVSITGKYVSITTYRRDGTGVSTPVWFISEGGQLLVVTETGSGKVKRIGRNPFVTVAACSARGRLHGRPSPAIADLLPATEVERVKRLMGRKYRLDLIFIRPIRALQSLLHPERRSETTTVIAIRPTPT